MRVTIGRIGDSSKWRIEVRVPNKDPAQFERGSKGDAERLGAQLTGGRRDRIRWKDFPADAPVGAMTVIQHDPEEIVADAVKIAKAARIVKLLGQSARKVVDAMEEGAFDTDLGAIKATEEARERGPRKTVLREIKRRADLAG